MKIEQEVIDHILLRLNENTPRIEKCLRMLTEDEVWRYPNQQSNSIGNLIVHVCGNITQYIISSLGNTADQRVREQEFSIKGGISKAELIQNLQSTVDKASLVIKQIDNHALTDIFEVQGFSMSGIGIMIHVVEHFSYHTGQISFYTKLLKNKDLGYYADIDLNIKNISKE